MNNRAFQYISAAITIISLSTATATNASIFVNAYSEYKATDTSPVVLDGLLSSYSASNLLYQNGVGPASGYVNAQSNSVPAVNSTVQHNVSSGGSDAINELGYDFEVHGQANKLIPVSYGGVFILTSHSDESFTHSTASAKMYIQGTVLSLDIENGDFDNFLSGANVGMGTAGGGYGATVQVNIIGFDVVSNPVGASLYQKSPILNAYTELRGTFSGTAFVQTDYSGLAVGSVRIESYAGVGVTGYSPTTGHNVGGGVASSYLDPYLAIDASYLLGNPGTSLNVLDGVGNLPVQAIPEPSTAASLLMGLALLVSAIRSRKLKQALPNAAHSPV